MGDDFDTTSGQKTGHDTTMYTGTEPDRTRAGPESGQTVQLTVQSTVQPTVQSTVQFS